jgi:uncharacterized protein with NAD-binding domain and iron-sulfur cluster
MQASVAVVGGGIGGLSAAHELAARGYDVTMFEAAERVGGKARSFPGPDRGDGRPLPGEHGFRFFPGFYRHVVDTMARTPVDGETVADRLVPTEAVFSATTDAGARRVRIAPPESLAEWREALTSLFGGDQVPREEAAYFASRLLYLVTSCERRWSEEFETTPWWEFIAAGEMSPAYRKLLADGLTRSLVAMRPQVSSTRTIGHVYLQLLRGRFEDDLHGSRVLNGPTSEVWLDPWADHLVESGVTIRTSTPATGVESDGERVTGVTVREDGGERTVTADHYALAVPAEAAVELVSPSLERAAPSLAGLAKLETGWMNGVQFYLAEDVPVVRGHGAYYDSPWALTSVSQAQFWDEDLRERGAGDVGGVLSVIVSEWDEPGVVTGKPARDCTREEFVADVWAQLQAHFEAGGVDLPDALRVDHFVDPTVEFGPEGVAANGSELLVNTAGSLAHRPEAATAAPNLVLAADYVRTETDLASMEAANEAARHAVNAILDRTGFVGERCATWEFPLPGAFAPLRREDAFRYRLGLPHPLEAGSDAFRGMRSLSRSLSLGGLLDG